MASTKFPNDRSGKLFDTIYKELDLYNDRQLAEKSGLNISKISKIRNGHCDLSAADRELIQVNMKYDLDKIFRLMKAK